MKIMSIIAVVVLAGVGVLGDYLIKLSGSGSKYILYVPFFTGMIVYAFTAIGWFYVMKHINLSSLGIFYSLTTAILLLIVGAVFFDEQLNVYDVAGVVLGIISIVLLSRFT